MSRQRFIYPEIFTSADFMGLSHAARLLWVGLFTTADDYGRGRADPASLKAAIFPGDPHSQDDLAGWLHEITLREMAQLYTVAGHVYYQIPTWPKYQNPRYKAVPKVPPPQKVAGARGGPPANPRRSTGGSAEDPRRTSGGSDTGEGCGGVGLGVVGCGVEGWGTTDSAPEPVENFRADKPAQESLPTDPPQKSKPGPRPTQDRAEQARRDRAARERLAQEKHHRVESAVGSNKPPRLPATGKLSSRALEPLTETAGRVLEKLVDRAKRGVPTEPEKQPA